MERKYKLELVIKQLDITEAGTVSEITCLEQINTEINYKQLTDLAFFLEGNQIQ